MIKEINKLIKPYIVKVDEGGCYIKIPLSEWDFILAKILGIVYKDIKELFKEGLQK